jgi:hypothetical protein
MSHQTKNQNEGCWLVFYSDTPSTCPPFAVDCTGKSRTGKGPCRGENEFTVSFMEGFDGPQPTICSAFDDHNFLLSTEFLSKLIF